MPAGIQVSPGPDQINIPASFAYGPELVFPGAELPMFTGSPAGVPQVDKIAGQMSPDATGNASASPGAYAARKTGIPAHSQPLFWSFALMVIGALLITHAARINLRGVGL